MRPTVQGGRFSLNRQEAHQRRGIVPRVCAASLSSLLRPRMTKAEAAEDNRKRRPFAATLSLRVLARRYSRAARRMSASLPFVILGRKPERSGGGEPRIHAVTIPQRARQCRTGASLLNRQAARQRHGMDPCLFELWFDWKCGRDPVWVLVVETPHLSLGLVRILRPT